jgi:hypothetical protein
MMIRFKLHQTIIALACVIPAIATAEEQPSVEVTAMTPPPITLKPSPRYWPRLRMWQGIPSIARAPGGRLWATWYAGPLSEGSEGNYAVLVTSGDDGRTWSDPVAVFDPGLLFGGNTGDPHVWTDPQGRLWWFVNRFMRIGKTPTRGLWGLCAEKSDDPVPKFNAPVFAGTGVGLNKPTVLANGDWLRPVDTFKSDPDRTHYYISHDQGKSYKFLSKLPIADVSFSEHMVVERKDGSLLMMARTTYGISQAESFDKGVTWKNERRFTDTFNRGTRISLTKLKGGELLLVANDHPKSRTNMTAMLSQDEGKTWPYKLLLDERPNVSYPDACESPDGFIYVAYDRGRYMKDQQEILFAKITADDIRAGKVVDSESRLKQMINRLADFGGGVHVDREPQRMTEKYEAQYGK